VDKFPQEKAIPHYQFLTCSTNGEKHRNTKLTFTRLPGVMTRQRRITGRPP